MYVYMYIYIYSLDDGVQVEILKSQLATQSTPKNDEVADFWQLQPCTSITMMWLSSK